MSRWKELPDSLDQRVRQLVVQLRRLKDRSGLSLVALEARTGYSRSSWERYLNGKALPPRHAVEELARATGTEPTRLLVLHEVAEEAWQQRVASSSSSSAGAKDDGGRGAGSRSAAERAGAAEGPAGSAEESAESTESAASAEEPGAPEQRSAAAGGFRPPGVRRSVALAAVVAAALVGLGTGTLIPAPWRDDDGRGDAARAVMGTPGPRPSGSTATATATQGPGRYVFQMGKSYPCEVREGRTAGGGLGAGYSTTGTAVLAGPGWDVVEAQCLLRHHKIDPGTVDGVYGQRTIAAVARLQKRAGLPADGIVGPHTWQVLRR
ncbi:helix-turn-helix domain-containing protein [Streptomyces sp. RKCA744]|uniref:helix-turn-helix domain-containing protein n=1 Tax=Streptomyces sp. RKCA744 TaxID=2959340 RepID=UPI00209E0196|nr:peptidoglycan-binding protein [Streptomyces sp. RKCA744]MCO8304281.1 peptidoglycan-binding protein [Streptomyces sp. RKCA744]